MISVMTRLWSGYFLSYPRRPNRAVSRPLRLAHLAPPNLRRLRRAAGPATLSSRRTAPVLHRKPPMSANTTAPLANEYFQIKRHGDVAVIVPSPEVEQLPDNLIQPAA